MNPLISVVVPFQNHRNFVESCWENLKLQTYSNIEVIFVNNGSSDGSEVLVETLQKANPGKIKLVSELRSGIPIARNKGLSEAKGELISFLDVDDQFTPQKLTILYNAFLEFPDAAMAYGETLRIYIGSGREVIQETGEVKPGLNHPPKLAADWIKSFYHLPQTGATLVKSSVVREIGGFPEDLRLGNDDVGFHIGIAMKYPIVFVPAIVVQYYRHEKSEGARLNDANSVHYRYLDAHVKFTNPKGKTHFKETGDISLWGMAQRSQFINYLNCIKSNLKINFPQMEFFAFYKIMLFNFNLFPFPVAKFIYKVFRRPMNLISPKKYPLN